MINEGKEWTEFQGPIQLDGYLKLKEQSPAPGTPAANYLNIYAKDKGGVSALFYKNDAGTEREIASFSASGVVGQVAFFDSTSSIKGDNNLFWNNVDKRLGIGTNVPSVSLHVASGQVRATQPTATAAFFALSNANFGVGDHIRGLAMGVDGTNGAADIRLEKRSAGNAVAMEFLTFDGSAYAERGRFASDGRFVVNSTSESFHTGTDGKGSFENDGNNCIVEINAHAAAGNAYIFAHRSRGTHSSPTIVSDGDTVFGILGKAYGGSSYHDMARIFFQVDGTPGNNDMPGRIVFYTTPDGSGSLSERVRIDNKGNVVINTAALATNATDGFLYIPTSAGAPTGTPTAYTGRVAMEYDTTNNKLYIYNGAWKSVALA
jgi:hypothetical protein